MIKKHFLSFSILLLLGTVAFILYDTITGYKYVDIAMPDFATYFNEETFSSGRNTAKELAPLGFDKDGYLTLEMGKEDRIYTEGFSYMEGSHRWTEGNMSRIIIPISDNEFKRLEVEIDGIFISDSQSVIILLNGTRTSGFFSSGFDSPYFFRIPASEVKDGLIDISFIIDGATSPYDEGINPDTRLLGLMLKSIKMRRVG